MTLEEYISLHSTAENDALEAITRDTHIHILNPHMLSGHVQGRVLSMISYMIHPKRILELGTFTGYSALCLAEGLAEGGELITIEHNDELEETIRRNLSRSSLGDRIELRIGDCKLLIGDLDGSFDLRGIVGINAPGQRDFHKRFSHFQSPSKLIQELFYCQNIREPCYLKDFHDGSVYMLNLHGALIAHHLLGGEQHANTRGGNVLQLTEVENQLRDAVINLPESAFQFRRGDSVQTAFKGKYRSIAVD